jgi:hypothetical protein
MQHKISRKEAIRDLLGENNIYSPRAEFIQTASAYAEEYQNSKLIHMLSDIRRHHINEVINIYPFDCGSMFTNPTQFIDSLFTSVEDVSL